MLAILTTLLTFYFSNNNIITLLIGIEILLLNVTLHILYIGSNYNDINGTIYALFIIVLAGAESAIGLSLLVSFYRLRGKIHNVI